MVGGGARTETPRGFVSRASIHPSPPFEEAVRHAKRQRRRPVEARTGRHAGRLPDLPTVLVERIGDRLLESTALSPQHRTTLYVAGRDDVWLPLTGWLDHVSGRKMGCVSPRQTANATNHSLTHTHKEAIRPDASIYRWAGQGRAGHVGTGKLPKVCLSSSLLASPGRLALLAIQAGLMPRGKRYDQRWRRIAITSQRGCLIVCCLIVCCLIVYVVQVWHDWSLGRRLSG